MKDRAELATVEEGELAKIKDTVQFPEDGLKVEVPVQMTSDNSKMK